MFPPGYHGGVIMKSSVFGTVLAIGLALAATAALAESPLERGTYLMRAVAACGNCHTPMGPDGPLPGMELAGGMVIEMDPFTARVPNITPDRETGIGAWTDAQIATAIREGRRPDGSLIGPPMAFALYRDISDADIQAIVAYLRSVPPVRNAVARSEYRMPLPPAWGPPVGAVDAPDRTDTIAWGRYLAGPVAHCIECHSTPDANHLPDFVNGLGGGGMAFPGPWGVSHGSNITPTGLAGWTDAQIAAAVRTGVRPDGSRLMPPMAVPYYAAMSDADIGAIIAWLRTLEPK